MIFFVFINVSFAEISSPEKQALLDFYEATNGQNWTKKWNLNEPVATWFGVKVENDKVIGLSLESNNLVGFVPASIGNLTSLEVLNLKKNLLHSAIPSQLFEIESLVDLNLSFNRFVGSLPENIGNAKNLVSVQIFMNQLTGTIPVSIGELENLQVLSVFNNFLTGNLPQTIFDLTNLKELLLNSNRLTGELSSEVTKLKSIKVFSLFDNQLVGQIPSLKQLVNLTELNISYNNFTSFADNSVFKDRLKLTMFDNSDASKTISLLETRTNLESINLIAKN